MDAARLAEELRQEQDHSGHLERQRRAVEQQVFDNQIKFCSTIFIFFRSKTWLAVWKRPKLLRWREAVKWFKSWKLEYDLPTSASS